MTDYNFVPVGAALDELGLVVDLQLGTRIAKALVILVTIDEDGQEVPDWAFTDDMGWDERISLLTWVRRTEVEMGDPEEMDCTCEDVV